MDRHTWHEHAMLMRSICTDAELRTLIMQVRVLGNRDHTGNGRAAVRWKFKLRPEAGTKKDEHLLMSGDYNARMVGVVPV